MSEYMTFERLQAIAKEVGASFDDTHQFDVVNIPGTKSEEFTDVVVVGVDGDLISTNLKKVSRGWIQVKPYYDGYLTYYEDIHYYNWLWYGRTWGSYSITEAQIKKGLAILQARERKPIFVGTKQVSAIYVKQNGAIKPAKPYIKQSGQIKAL